jgi:hypothetical protein
VEKAVCAVYYKVTLLIFILSKHLSAYIKFSNGFLFSFHKGHKMGGLQSPWPFVLETVEIDSGEIWFWVQEYTRSC